MHFGKDETGPVAYGACLNRQIASLQSSPGIPNLSGHDSQTRQAALPTSRSARANPDKSRTRGTALAKSPGIPNLSGYDSQTRQAALPTSRSGGANSDKSRTGGTAAHSVDELVPFIAPVIILFIYLTPVIWVLLSGRSRGGSKFGWFMSDCALLLVRTRRISHRYAGNKQSAENLVES